MQTIDPLSKPSYKLKQLFRGRKAWSTFCSSLKQARGNACEWCGKSGTKVILNVHHRCFPAKTMGEYMDLEPKRFLLLCTDCHAFVHAVNNSPNFKDKKWCTDDKTLKEELRNLPV